MSSTPESGDIHDVSHVVPFLGASARREPQTPEMLEAEATSDAQLQDALDKVVQRARELFGGVRNVSFHEDPEIEGRTYFIVEVPACGTDDEVLVRENQWLEFLDTVSDFIPRFSLHLNFRE